MFLNIWPTIHGPTKYLGPRHVCWLETSANIIKREKVVNCIVFVLSVVNCQDSFISPERAVRPSSSLPSRTTATSILHIFQPDFFVFIISDFHNFPFNRHFVSVCRTGCSNCSYLPLSSNNLSHHLPGHHTGNMGGGICIV